MKWFLASLTALLCVTNVALGASTIAYVQNPDPAPGYTSYTIQVSGSLINCLGDFNITGDIHQVWTADDAQSEWINNPNGNTPGDAMDSYVLFGEDRDPDLPNSPWGGTSMTPKTVEIIDDGTAAGLGTMNNLGAVTGDLYFNYGEVPSTDTLNLMKLVVPHGEQVKVEADIYFYPQNEQVFNLVLRDSFFGEDAFEFTANCINPVPEPSTIILLTLGLMASAFARPKNRR